MVIYVDDENKIRAVDDASDPSLTPIEITEDNPFEGWSIAKICCHKVYTSQVRVTPYPEPTIEIIDGEEVEVPGEDVPEEEIEYKTVVSGYTPYVDSRLLDTIDMLGKTDNNNSKETADVEDALCEETSYVEDRLAEIENALCELSESEV